MSRVMDRTILCVLAIISIGSTTVVVADKETAATCSIVQLIADPRTFDGKRVLTYGFATIGPERNYLYLSREDADHGLLTNAVLLDFPTIKETLRHAQLDRRYVLIEGRFDASHRDAFVPANGGLRDITRFELVEPMLTLEDLQKSEQIEP